MEVQIHREHLIFCGVDGLRVCDALLRCLASDKNGGTFFATPKVGGCCYA